MTATPLPEVLTRGAVPAQVLARWGADVADALAAAHRNGAAHGDVRADVVHIAQNGSATLDGFDAHTGAPRHPAPEQATNPGPSAAADVYALGAMLFQAGGAVLPEMAGVWPWLGHADLTQRPSAAQAAEHLRTFAAQTTVPPAGLPVSAAQTPTISVTKPRKSRGGLWVALALILVVMLVGGVVWAAWAFLSPGAGPVEAGGPIGDVRTADPCSLLTVPVLTRFGTGTVYPEEGSPNTCRIWVQGSNGAGTWVSAAISEPSPDDRDLEKVRAQRIGALTLYSVAEVGGYCSRKLLLPDRSRVFLGATTVGAATQDPCAMADAELPSVLSALDGSSLPRRTLDQPPNSLVNQPDICALGSEPVLRTIAGLNIGRRARTSGGWICQWGADPAVVDSATVVMSVQRSQPLAGQPTTIGDRTAIVTPNGWSIYTSSCVVNLIQRSYPGAGGSTVAEYLVVQLHVNNATTPEAQCTAATALAQAAGDKLPPPN